MTGKCRRNVRVGKSWFFSYPTKLGLCKNYQWILNVRGWRGKRNLLLTDCFVLPSFLDRGSFRKLYWPGDQNSHHQRGAVGCYVSPDITTWEGLDLTWLTRQSLNLIIRKHQIKKKNMWGICILKSVNIIKEKVYEDVSD